MKNEIYYFTGSGNSLDIAKRIAEDISDCRVRPISSSINMTSVDIDAETLGIIFPVYFMETPDLVKNFLKRIRTKSECYIYIICNSGGAYGGTLKQADQILSKRQVKLSAAFNIFMPDNSIAFPTQPEKQKVMLEDMIAECRRISEIIRERKEQAPDGKSLETFFGRTVMKGICTSILGFDKMKLDTLRCNACGICTKVCPVNNIEMSNKTPVWAKNCTMCFACIHHCEKEAVTYKRQKIKGPYRYTNPRIKVSELF